MVAIVTSNTLGLNLSSLSALGATGPLGTPTQGRNGEAALVNASTGNLVLQDQDGLVVGVGQDLHVVRTYNSQGLANGSNNDGWLNGLNKTVTRLDAATLQRTDGDGSTVSYVYNATTQLYVQKVTAGSAADSIKVNTDGSYLWTDGGSGIKETYSAAGQIVSATDTSGNTQTYAYTGGLLTKVTDADGEYVSFTYGGASGKNLLSQTSTLQSGTTLSQVTYTYDAQNRLSTVSVSLNPTGTVPAGGDVLSSYVTTYGYDGSSTRVTSVTQSDKTALTFSYVLANGVYKVATATDGDGNVTSYGYNTNTNTTTVTDPLGVSSVYQYDTAGNLTQVRTGVTASNPNGLAQLVYSYNSLAEVTQIVDGLGNTVSLQYDANGNQTSQVDAAGDTVVRSYNANNQLQTETAYAVPANVGTGTAASGAMTTRYVYAAANPTQLRYQVSAEGAVTEYRYNAQGLRTSTISYADADYPVSGLGATAVPTEAQMQTWVSARDLTQSQRTDAAYDFRGQLQSTTTYASVDATGAGVTAGASTTQYVHDLQGHLLQTISADTRTITQYIYDGLGRVVSTLVKSSDGTLSSLTLAQYDDANGKTTLTQANGLNTVSVYDAAGRLTSVVQTAASTTLGTTQYVYDADGRLLMSTDPTGVRHWMMYDAAGRKVADIDGAGDLTEYVYNADNQATQSVQYATAVNVTTLVDSSGHPTTGYNANPTAAPTGATVVTLSTLRPAASAQDVKNWNLYDTAGRLALQVNGVGDATLTQYDGASRVTSVSQLATQINTATLGNGAGVKLPSIALATSSTSLTNTVSGSTHTLTATVGSAIAANHPTGAVTFYEVTAGGPVSLGVAALVNGVAVLNTARLPAGTLAYAVYSGDANNPTSASTQVGDAATAAHSTTTTLTASAATQAGASVTLTAQISGASPGGNVVFYRSGVAIGVAVVNTSGVAVLQVDNLPVGSNSITATYQGDAHNTVSASTAVTQTITQATSVTTLALSTAQNSNRSVSGTSVTLTARVSGAAPSGNVSFYSGTTLIGTATASNGLASLVVTTLAVGADSLTAKYAGDANNTSSTSTAAVETVLTGTTTALTVSSSASGLGAPVLLSATVTGATPGGTVSFFNGATLIGSASVSAGIATLVYTPATLGVAAIQAVYSGDAVNAASTSATVNDAVQTAGTTITLGSTNVQSVQGSAVTLTATVVNVTGAPLVGGTVTFYNGSTAIGSGAVTVSGNTGVATLSLSNLPNGADSLHAVFGGDANDSGSTSSVMVENVSALATTSLALTTSAPSASVGSSITLTATVSATTAATGVVTFYNGNAVLGTAAITSGKATLSLSSLPGGADSLRASYAGDATHAGSVAAALAETITPLASTTVVTSTAPTTVMGAAVILTAKVTGTAALQPTGSITFYSGTTAAHTLLGTATVVDGLAALTLSSLPTTTATVYAVYAGDASNAASTSATTVQTVSTTTAVTSSTLTATPASAALGASVTLTAHVTGTTPSGLVTFFNGQTALGTAVIAGGVATLVTQRLPSGTASLTATYAGDLANATSVSTAATVTIGTTGTTPAAPSLTATTSALSLSSATSVRGTALTLTATIAAGSGKPTGTVSFFAGSTLLGSTNVTSTTGQASITLNTPAGFAIGANSVKAVYSGDATFATSASAASTETVALASTTSTLALASTSAVAGKPVQLVAQIKGNSPNVLPSGTVTFYNGSTSLGTATIVNGLATLSASLTAGTASLKAIYFGDTNNATSTSAVSSLPVAAALATSAIALTTSSTASALGSSVTLTATVTGTTPSGTVSFFDGTTLLGSAVVSAGVATLATSSLAGGAHALTAVYSGDAANNASASAAASDTVALAATTSTLSTSANSAVAGSAVVLTARVSNAAGINPPGGTVTFYNGATMLGTGTLVSGVATLSVATLPKGIDALRVTYGGDANNAASTSLTFNENISAAASTLHNTSAASIPVNGSLTVSVTGTSPTGVVTLFNGKTVLATAAVTAGVATFSPANLPVGTSNLTVTYSGDASNASSVLSLSQTVTAAPTVTQLSVTPSSYQAQFTPVVLTASVAGSNPTGLVSFYDGTVMLGQVTLSNGLAAITVPGLPVGANSLTVKYAGDANNAASTSSASADSVITAPVNVTVSSSSSSLAQGTSVTLTAYVSGNNPTGTVTFVGNNQIGLGTATVVNGLATLVVSSLQLPVGNQNVTAVYSGDAANPSAASASLAQTVTAGAAMISPLQTAADRTTTRIYNNDGQLRATIDGEGGIVEYRYDTAGRLVQTVSYANPVPGFTSAASIATLVATARSADSLAGLIPAINAADINAYTFYNDEGEVVGQVDGAGYLTETLYTANGQVAKTIRYATLAAGTLSVHATLATLRPASNAEDHVTTVVWDALGRMSTQTNAEGTVTQYTYDVMGNVLTAVTALSTTDQRSLQTQYDVQGRVTAELSADGAALLTGSQTTAQINAIWTQYATTYQYDAAGRKVSSVDPLANKTLYYYDAAGRLAYQVNPAGDVTQVQYDALGHLKATTQYATVLSAAQLASMTGGVLTTASQAIFTTARAANAASNVTTSATYDAAGEQVSSTDALSQVTTQTYNAFGQALAQTQTISGQALVTTDSYDRRGLLIGEQTTSGSLSVATSRQYDAFGRLINAKDANLNTSSWAYDRLGRVVTTTDGTRVSAVTTYDAFGRVLTQGDAYGQNTTYTYNTASRSVTVKTPLGVTLDTTVHNREGQALTVTDGNGATTTYQYDADGNLLKTTTPLNSVSNVFDADDRLTQTTDADGHVTALAYDAASRVYTETVDPSGLKLKTTYAYDAMGHQVTVTDPAGIVTQIAYDLDGEVLKTTVDPTGLNLVTQHTYDSVGHTLTVTSPGGVVTKYVYDGLGRRTQTITDPIGLNLVQTYAYDADGNVVTSTDPAGAVTRYAYDADNRQVYTVNALGDVAYTLYDSDGHVSQTIRYVAPIAVSGTAPMSAAAIKALVVATPGKDVVQGNYFDRDGHLTYSVDGMGDVVHYVYDADGNVVDSVAYATRITPSTWSVPPAMGTVPTVTASPSQDHETRTVYDALDRATYLLSSTAGGTWAVKAYTYDAKGNVLSTTRYATPIPAATAATSSAVQGAVAAIVNATLDVTQRFVYDNADRETWSVDGTGAVAQTVYDADGNVVKQVAYAARIAATAVPSSVAAGAADRVSLMAYDSAGRLVYAEDALGNVVRTAYAYSSTGSTITSTAFATPQTALTTTSAVRSSASLRPPSSPTRSTASRLRCWTTLAGKSIRLAPGAQSRSRPTTPMVA